MLFLVGRLLLIYESLLVEVLILVDELMDKFLIVGIILLIYEPLEMGYSLLHKYTIDN